MTPKKWFKKDLKWLCGQIDTFMLQQRLYRSPEWIKRALAEHRTRIVATNARAFRDMLAERAKSDRETAQHAEDHPKVWGNSTQSMIDRFTASAVENDKAVARIDGLLQRIEAEGLPEEVVSYSPFAEED